MQKVIKEITPPILNSFYKRITSKYRKYGWSGNYDTWEEALQHSEGYDSTVIVEKVKESLLKVKNGEALFERDSVLFDKIEYSWPLLAGLLWAAARHKGELNVLDFGGSLGGTYFQNKKFFEGLTKIDWSIVEQPKFIDYGNRFFGSDQLKYFDTIEECFSKQNPQVVLFSCVLQYLAKPFDIIDKVMGFNPEIIVVDSMPFLEKGKTRITVQKVDPGIYEASYPCWMFNKSIFINAFKPYEIVENFGSALSIRLDGDPIPYEGFIFKRKE